MMTKRRVECTNRGDEVEIEEIANPLDAGDDGDRLLRKMEDILSEPFGLVSGVLSNHGGEGREAEEVGVGRGS
jgi:hypothetical protein